MTAVAGVPAIAARGLVKRYGSRTVVDGIDLDVAAGELVALLGPNGAGKTTTVELDRGLPAGRTAARSRSSGRTRGAPSAATGRGSG